MTERAPPTKEQAADALARFKRVGMFAMITLALGIVLLFFHASGRVPLYLPYGVTAVGIVLYVFALRERRILRLYNDALRREAGEPK